MHYADLYSEPGWRAYVIEQMLRLAKTDYAPEVPSMVRAELTRRKNAQEMA